MCEEEEIFEKLEGELEEEWVEELVEELVEVVLPPLHFYCEKLLIFSYHGVRSWNVQTIFRRAD